MTTRRTWVTASAGLVVASALVGVTWLLGSSSGDGPVESVAPDQPTTTAPPTSAAPTAAVAGEPGCAVPAETPLPEEGPLCAQAQLVVRRCRPEPGSLALVSDAGGEAAWAFRREGRNATARTDSDGTQRGLLSCGTPTNGVDVSAMLAGVREEARTGWGISVGSVSCMSNSRRPVDEVPLGESVIYCEVLDGEGNGSPAYVSVTSDPPHFVVHLGE